MSDGFIYLFYLFNLIVCLWYNVQNNNFSRNVNHINVSEDCKKQTKILNHREWLTFPYGLASERHLLGVFLSKYLEKVFIMMVMGKESTSNPQRMQSVATILPATVSGNTSP